ncbi:uncharacterized protein LOC115998281 [Ipomoea triloba]|uniref:uncharacterized protein LOC115998281 n=1 Tax=Ipomoea triloba TaxID=35885 RepID=UPI00125D3830|nr:uncharacterized protein LOC115998281 [Ipomoea triloba]
MSTVHESHLHDNPVSAADGVGEEKDENCQPAGDEDIAVAEASHQGYFDFPPESFWVPKDSELDWFDQNATMQRKTSLKLGFSGAGGNRNHNNNKKNFSHRSFSTLNHKHKSSSLIALPKSQKSSGGGGGAEGNLRQNKAATATARLFRSRSAPGGKRALQQGVEPGSPKVSCTGRVRAKREGGKRTGLWKKLRTVLKNRLGAKRVVNKASSESAGSMGFESGRWSES